MTQKLNIKTLLPIMFSFFVMGFVDVVGIANDYVKADFKLSDTMANLLPMMVFLWFAVFSLPTGLAMNKFGRKNTVLFSAIITTAGMLIPLFNYSFVGVLIAFAVLGIGNTILQVSLNPLVSNIVSQDKLTGTLTFGQFVKAICSFLGPIIVSFSASFFGNWKLIFFVYAITSLISFVWLWLTPISRETGGKTSSFSAVLGLLKNKYNLMLFSVIVLIVGYEVGLINTITKFLTEQFGIAKEDGAYAISLYFIARTIGTFSGSILLSYFNPKKFLVITVGLAVVCFAAMLIVKSSTFVHIALFMIGLLCANVFAIIFGEGLNKNKEMANEISALMIMGVAGGALIPPIMGLISDNSSQQISLIVPLACLIYILFTAMFMAKQKPV